MLVSATRRRVAALAVVLGASAGFSPVHAGHTVYEEAISRAVRLLPRQPDQIVLIERDHRSGARTGKAHVEAFVNHGSGVTFFAKGSRCRPR